MRIVANTRRGEAELKAGLGKQSTLNKIREILQNPEIGETLTQNLASYRSVQVGSWVVIYKAAGNEIWFVNFDHHDYV